MGGAVGVVFDAFHHVLTRLAALEVHRSNSPPRTTTSMPHDDTSSVVATTLAMTDFCEREFGVRLALPQMVVDNALQVADTGRPGLIRLQVQHSRSSAGGRWRVCGDGCGGGIFGCAGGLQRLRLSGDVSAGRGGEEAAVGGADGSYPGLQHGRENVCESRGGLYVMSWVVVATRMLSLDSTA